MTLRARALGMQRTLFENASGLPDPDQVTTARDMAVLARHLIQDYPGEYHYFSTPEFVFHGRTILNHDHLLITYPGADGMKTGYTHASGYNLVTSAVRGETRLIGVVLGAGSGGERDRHMEALLDQGFQQDGVPVLVAHRDVPWHVAQAAPALMAAAHADEMPPPPVRARREPGLSLRMAAAYGWPRAEGRGHGHHRDLPQVVDAGPVRRAGFSRAIEVAEAPGELPHGARLRRVQAIVPPAFEPPAGHAHHHGTAGRKPRS
jgi:D-alanyl-D-alanine carboxypeptidase